MKKGKKRVITGFGVFLGLTLLGAVIFYMSFTTIEVSGISMQPTLKDHQHVLVSKAYWLIGSIHDKDIVVLNDPTGPGHIIKRVMWMAGENVDYRWRPDSAPASDKPYPVPEGCIYVLGDNRPFSEDSRKFGFVDMKQVIGKVVVYK